MPYLIKQYSGDSRRVAESIDADPEHVRILMLRSDGTREIVFQGHEFCAEGFQAKMERQGYQPFRIDAEVPEEAPAA